MYSNCRIHFEFITSISKRASRTATRFESSCGTNVGKVFSSVNAKGSVKISASGEELAGACHSKGSLLQIEFSACGLKYSGFRGTLMLFEEP